MSTYFIPFSLLPIFFVTSFFLFLFLAMENMNKPETLQIITSRILQNLKNLQGTYALFCTDRNFLHLFLAYFAFS